MAIEYPSTGDPLPLDAGIIEIHISDVDQLFNSFDPAPFYDKDLDDYADDYIVCSARELLAKMPLALIIYLDRSAKLTDESQTLGTAIRSHFARRAQRLQLELRQLLRRGWISLGIGLAFLALCLVGGHFVMRLLSPNPLAIVLEQGLLIGGWVAMWRPLEIFLYDWWPILGERRICERLSRIAVRIAIAVGVSCERGTGES